MKEKRPLENMTKEELIKKCQNQKGTIKDYKRQIEFLKNFIDESNLSRKIKICYEETISLFDDIEGLKKQ